MPHAARHFHVRSACLVACAAAWLASGPCFGQEWPRPTFEASWTHLAGGPSRRSAVDAPAPSMANPRWVCTSDIDGNPITFLGQACPTVFAGEGVQDGLVFATGLIDADAGGATLNPYRLFAISRSTGLVAWQAAIEPPTLESNPSPTIDERRRTVLVASGRVLRAWRISDGSLAWSFTSPRDFVNVSPLVTQDRGPADRALVCSYDGGLTSSGAAVLSCINVAAFDAVRNPFQPGDVVWQASVSTSSGNSVAYMPREEGGEDLAVVASPGRYRMTPGTIRAWRIDPPSLPPSPMWTRASPLVQGFFGGVCLSPPPEGSLPGVAGSVLAATYSFFGGIDSATLVKIDARTGGLRWSAPSNRTQSIPVPVGPDRVALAGGLDGYSTRPTLSLLQESAGNAATAWNTPDTMTIGGWTNQPILWSFGGRTMLAVGTPPAAPTPSFDNPYELSGELLLVDLDRAPTDPGFVVRRWSGVGGGAAATASSLYAVGLIGLAAFGPTPADLDIDGSSTIGADDLYAWESSPQSRRDLDGDGVIGADDRAALMVALRSRERALLKGGRR
ncbi:MAG: PQQ-binding-like beta-propeller repeat protein [Phycisphaerae bacterium]